MQDRYDLLAGRIGRNRLAYRAALTDLRAVLANATDRIDALLGAQVAPADAAYTAWLTDLLALRDDNAGRLEGIRALVNAIGTDRAELLVDGQPLPEGVA